MQLTTELERIRKNLPGAHKRVHVGKFEFTLTEIKRESPCRGSKCECDEGPLPIVPSFTERILVLISINAVLWTYFSRGDITAAMGIC